MFDFTQLSADSILLTPNSRLSRYLRREFKLQFMLTEQTVRPTPTILPLQVWLQKVYLDNQWQFSHPASILSTNQEALIWQSLIKESALGGTLLQTQSTATLVQQAYRLLTDWTIPADTLNEQDNVDAIALQHWIEAFMSYCQQHAVLSAVNITEQLLQQTSIIADRLPKKIFLYAFDEMSPLAGKLFTQLQTLGVQVERIHPNNIASEQHLVICHDVNDEITTMARWAKHAHLQNPDQKILCVVPNLTQIRAKIMRIFAQVFFPEHEFSPNFTQETYNISGGYALSQAPIIYLALQVLHLNTHAISVETLTTLLTSPFINGYANEADARACLDLQLRKLDEPRLTWNVILKQAENTTPALFEPLDNFLTELKALPKTQTLTYWSKKLYQLLCQIGWPGERNLNSTEHQQMKRFIALLQELPSLTIDKTDFSLHEAIVLLNDLTRSTLFEIESHDGPVQILGVLEAAGTCNDQLWFMNLDDETWPQRPQANAFIPFKLQVDHKMPHCNAERELNFAKRLLQSLQQSNKTCYFSYHQYEQDKHFNKSPLLADVAETKITALAPVNTITRIDNAISLSRDDTGPALTDAIAKGGTGIFKSQAACPFQAFARYRLHAQSLPCPESGLDHLDRGILLHSCLDKLWQQLKTQQTLINTSVEKLDQILTLIIEQAIQESLSKELQPVFKNLETHRLKRLLLNWLALEKQRPAFQVVAHEQWRQIKIGRINVNVQIDRLDKLADGEKLVIDYKSGKPSVGDWFGTRPKEPQLPLYCLTENDITSVAFAQVRIDDLAFKGISADSTDIKGITTLDKVTRHETPESWQQLIAEWQMVLDKLADDFLAGDALVDPVAYNTCDHCELHSLCRINERLGLANDQ